ncbi:MAG TPA: hypothetical protein VFI17_08065 [Solirubrobacterales bacterium]|nr:hypothetical protein [Solirubrobacterales bacterium]
MALLAVAGGTAQAAEFRAEKYPALTSGEQTGTGTGKGTILAFEGQMTECGAGGFEGELAAAAPSLTIEPHGSGCTAFGVSSAELLLNGCTYRLHPGTGSSDNFSGSLDIVCPEGQSITVIGNGCEVKIGAQTGLEAVEYENLTATSPKKGLQVVFNIHNFTYTKVKDGIFCPLNGTGVGSDGTLVGKTRVTATNSGNADGLWIE